MPTAAGADTAVSRKRANEVLTPYVPRLVVDWLRETPDALHRELDGSMVFVDISGFTALSERLARRGKIGAELMRDTLNGVFAALLDEAYDYGAGLLKWGGDALLLLFDGPDHEKRACRAAWGMQRTLDRVGRLRAGHGTVTLRMSVGISTGSFQFFMAGSVHRELLVAGPGATETVLMEAIADAGEITLSPRLASCLEPTCVGPLKEGTFLLAAPPDVERERASDVGDVSAIDIPSCIPIAARAHVLLERSEPEHRTITAAFIDLMDTDVLLDRLGVDALAEALDERLHTIQEVALRYEVPFYESDVGKGSIKILLTAGAPSSTGHDEERMLRALREIMDTSGVVPMRVGVNTGKVFTGDFGPPYRRSYRVFGDAINTAARVMSRAEPGQILSTEIVLERSRTTFEAAPIEAFAAKGKTEPVRASVVGEVTGKKEAHRSEMPLIGRELELEAMLDVVERARQRQGWVIEIAGSAGMGKSRLMEEVIARSPDVTVLHARCEEYEASTPYFAFRGLMRNVLRLAHDADGDEVERRLSEIVGRVDPDLVPWIPLLGILLGLDLSDTPETAVLDERFLRERLGELTMQFLFTMLAGTPTMIAVEDVQFMDEASRDLLLRLARANTELRHVILVTSGDLRSLWAPTDEDEIRTLAVCLLPLPVSRMIAIAEQATEDDPLAPHDVEAIARRAGGNALFLFELLEAVRRTGTVEAMPYSVESLIAGDIDRLSPEDRTVLRYAAVLGGSFEPALLAEASRAEVTLEDGVWNRLADFVDVEQSGTMRFRNTLIRDAAYEGLPYRRRRELHARIGEAIEAHPGVSPQEEVGILALHFHEAQQWDKAWKYARLAAERAMEIYANVEAVRFSERALVAGRRLRSVSATELAAVYEQLGDVRYRLGEFERSDVAFRAARRLVPRASVDAARIATKQANTYSRLARYPQTIRRVSRALAELEGARGRDVGAARARLYTLNGWVRYSQGRPGEAIEWCTRSVAEARRARAKDALAQAYRILDVSYTLHDRVDQAVFGERALALYEELGDLWQQASTLNNLALVAKERSQWTEAEGYLRRAKELYEQTGDLSMAALAKANLGEVLGDQGRGDEAEQLFRDAIRVWRAADAAADAAWARGRLGRIAARRFALEEARELFANARAAQQALHQHFDVLTTDLYLAEALALAGESTAALEVANDSRARADTVEGGSILDPLAIRVRSWALLALGDIDGARQGFAAAFEKATERHNLYDAILAQDGLIAAARLRGDASDHLVTTQGEAMRQLGIENLPPFPASAAPLSAVTNEA